MSNIGLYKAFDAVGIDYEKTAVGDKYVYECMRENEYKLGGEESGHIILVSMQQQEMVFNINQINGSNACKQEKNVRTYITCYNLSTVP